MKPVFRVRFSDGWITCIPQNKEAVLVINGKMGALWPGPRVAEPYVSFEEFIRMSKIRHYQKAKVR